jgi:hypothetical protein
MPVIPAVRRLRPSSIVRGLSDLYGKTISKKMNKPTNRKPEYSREK